MQLILDDPWLEPYHQALNERQERFLAHHHQLKKAFISLENWANGHLYFGFHRGLGPAQLSTVGSENAALKRPGYWYREWAPGALGLSLIGDFNQWNRVSHPLSRVGPEARGIWEIFIPDVTDPTGDSPGLRGLEHRQKLKVQVTSAKGSEDRIPLYAKRAVQDPVTLDFAAQLWDPPQPFVWDDEEFRLGLKSPQKSASEEKQLFIYEAHIGMAQESEGVGTYQDFEHKILPRITRLGYNALQLMAIMEHPYYGSFGYHVANFFAASSRFGTPDELKSLINAAHRLGIMVFLDVVHSHAASNTREGLCGFDGTSYQFFHDGPRGHHEAWDSKLFDYGKSEVQHFLLSNLKFWIEEYHFDGFRFDGVTSMLYRHHGYGVEFDHYDRYFDFHGVDRDAILYLQLANALIQEILPQGISIAEDVSGMPGLASPIDNGGIGFNYRLAMGLPDYWVNLVQTRDEDWSPEKIFRAMLNRRRWEKHIAYVESHDQCLVGDKTLIFRMADSAMYHHMSQEDDSPIVERAVSLSKMFRLITATCGGEGYLNFIGNEFGHPEWVDFPREGNQWSYFFARRQWSLADNPRLRYAELWDFDQKMIKILKSFRALQLNFWPELLCVHEDWKILTYRRGPLIFVFNFHVNHSRKDFPINLNHVTADPLVDLSSSILLTTSARFPQENPSLFQIKLHENTVYIDIPSRSAMILRI